MQYIWQGIWILNSSIIIGTTIYIFILGILILTNKRKQFKVRQSIMEVVFIIYTMALLKITGIIGIKFYLYYVMDGMYNLNLIPFRDASIMMVFLNFLLFIPYGFLLPCVFKNLIFNWKNVISIGFITSLTIEVLQLFAGRYAEIDDVIINSLGTLAGFMIYLYVSKKLSECVKFIKYHNSSV